MKKWKAVRDKFVKDPRQQKTMTIGQPVLKKKCCITLISCSFCCLLLAMENKLFPIFHILKMTWSMRLVVQLQMEQWIVCIWRGVMEEYTESQSYHGSWQGGRSTARERTKEYVILTSTKNISKIPSDGMDLQREESQSHKWQ